jgi:hypothetical protein
MSLPIQFCRSIVTSAAAQSTLMLTFGLALTPPAANAVGDGQSRMKLIKKMTYPREPFEITDIRQKGDSIQANEGFENNDSDWIKDVEFKCTNMA